VNLNTILRKRSAGALGPLHEDNPFGAEVLLQAQKLSFLCRSQAVEIDVYQLSWRYAGRVCRLTMGLPRNGVTCDHGKAGTGHQFFNPKCLSERLCEERLARPDVPREAENIPTAELRGKGSRNPFRFLGTA